VRVFSFLPLDMLSLLLRPRKGRRRVEQHSPFSSQFDQSSPVAARNQRQEVRHATADFTETDVDDENTEDEEEDEGDEEDIGNDEDAMGSVDDEDGEEDSPLLPIFSAAHLGNLHASPLLTRVSLFHAA